MDDKQGFDGIIAMKPSKSEEELGPGRINRFNLNFSKKITSRDSSIQLDSMICTRKKFIRQTDLLQKTLDQQYNSNLTRSISSQQVASNSTRSIPNQQYHSNLTRSISSHQLVYEDPTFDGRPETQHSIVYNGVDRPVNSHIESENLKYFDYKQVKSVPETRKHLVKQNDNVKINQLHNKKSNYKYSNTENSFKNLQPASSSSSLHKSLKSSKSPLVEFDATKLIDRMSKIVDTATSQVNSFLGSMHSHKKVTKNDDFQQNSSEDDHHSLTDEDHPPFQDPPIEDPTNNFKLDQNCHDEYPMNDDILIMFKEMEHYQKYMNNKHYNSEPLKMNRTTKKLNDYKDISPETPKLEFFQFSSTHKDKMLYETIVSQYTSIRCRYPSKIQVRPNSTKLKTNTGVLGFLNRYYNDINNKDSNDNNNQHLSKKLNKALPRNLEVSSNRSKNDLYLQSIWNKELEIFKDQDQDKESLSIKELTKTIVSS